MSDLDIYDIKRDINKIKNMLKINVVFIIQHISSKKIIAVTKKESSAQEYIKSLENPNEYYYIPCQVF